MKEARHEIGHTVNSIYMKLKNTSNKCMVIEIRIMVAFIRESQFLIIKIHKKSFWGDGIVSTQSA